ncbi:hypothetical protein RJ639_002910 [Escallonia herrerae]|uniref:ATVPS33 vacuolar protein sorting 33 n=1 Tax=Escallonia herrerae TaxID=1293975 RepID=A0AA89AY06_9ASTE|nr:hypothetical protein RJ639_002910 [Escallonia herrerae]
MTRRVADLLEDQEKTMAQIPNLDNAPLNFTSIRDQSQKELINILKNEHGVELRHLTADPIQTECTKVVYLVRSQIDLMKFICSHIHNDISKGLQREYYVYFVPRRAVVCEKILEEEKVHHLLNIGEYPLYAIPLDEDVLSFELDLAYKFSFGLIPNVRAKGKASVRVADILNRMQAEEPVNASDMGVPEINTLILIDRELLRINNGAVELDSSIMGVQQDGKKIKVPLNSRRRGEGYSTCPCPSKNMEKKRKTKDLDKKVLRQKATSMKQDYTEMSTTSQTVSELKDFVRKLNSLPEMTRHINLAQHLSTYTSKPAFLGRLDMEHTIVEAQSYDMRELLHSYGFEHMATLNNLEKAGLLKKQESKGNWLTVKRALQLVVDDTDTAKRPIEDILKLLPGPHSETKRSGFASSPSFDSLPGAPHTADKVGGGRRSLVLVVFIGGVTFAEISALRFLSAQEGMTYDLVVGTTKIVSGHTLTEAFVENLG